MSIQQKRCFEARRTQEQRSLAIMEIKAMYRDILKQEPTCNQKDDISMLSIPRYTQHTNIV